MRQLRLAGALLLLIILVIPPAVADQTLLLTYSTCHPLSTSAEVDATWGPNVNNCRKAAVNIVSGFHCLNQSCMNNCNGKCQSCNQKVCAASSITMDNACVGATSPLWITTFYQG
jgi:hypothetical protein